MHTRALSVALAAFALVTAGCLSGSPAEPTSEPPPSPTTGDDAPTATAAAWRFTDATGQDWTDESLEGRPALLFFFATWCSTCRAKAPTMAKLHGDYGDRVQFLSIDVDNGESDGDVTGWSTDKGHDWPHGVDRSADVWPYYRAQSTSTVVILGADGSVILNKYNAPESDMRAALDAALSA